MPISMWYGRRDHGWYTARIGGVEGDAGRLVCRSTLLILVAARSAFDSVAGRPALVLFPVSAEIVVVGVIAAAPANTLASMSDNRATAALIRTIKPHVWGNARR